MSWMDDANCKGKTELFYAPERERPPARAEREAKAKALCAHCPVWSECNEEARQREEWGIWAGAPEDSFVRGGLSVLTHR